jgi:hypothetical protein
MRRASCPSLGSDQHHRRLRHRGLPARSVRSEPPEGSEHPTLCPPLTDGRTSPQRRPPRSSDAISSREATRVKGFFYIFAADYLVPIALGAEEHTRSLYIPSSQSLVSSGRVSRITSRPDLDAARRQQPCLRKIMCRLSDYRFKWRKSGVVQMWSRERENAVSGTFVET